jgi:hypothetical protein
VAHILAVTIAANVGYGLPLGVPGALISGWPAIAFVGSVEMGAGDCQNTTSRPTSISQRP